MAAARTKWSVSEVKLQYQEEEHDEREEEEEGKRRATSLLTVPSAVTASMQRKRTRIVETVRTYSAQTTITTKAVIGRSPLSRTQAISLRKMRNMYKCSACHSADVGNTDVRGSSFHDYVPAFYKFVECATKKCKNVLCNKHEEKTCPSCVKADKEEKETHTKIKVKNDIVINRKTQRTVSKNALDQ